MNLITKLQAYIRLQRMKQNRNDLDTFTNDVYSAICSKNEYEQSEVINKIREMHENKLREIKKENDEYAKRIETALDNSFFKIV